MPNTLEEHSLGALLGELFDSPREKNAWTEQLCLTLDAAQDQKFFRVIEGGRVKTYCGLHKDTDEDVQSDAGREILKRSNAAMLDAAFQVLRRQAASRWYNLGMDASFDAESESCETARNDQLGIIDEIADEWTADGLAAELLSLDAENDWPRLRELILTAEDFDFTLEQSALLAPRFLALAVKYRESNDQQDAPAVWSAIRTGASMLRPSEASRLLALLEPGHPIETSLVALKMVGRIFEAQPPERPDQHTELAGKVRGIAESLLNGYAIASSHSAAMAQLAVCTLAAMASNDTLQIVRAVRHVGVSWFTQQTARELRELQSSWEARPVPVAPEVLGLLQRAVNELQAP